MEPQPNNSSEDELQFNQDSYQILTSPHQYLTWCKSQKKIKIMSQPNPLNPNLYLLDISLHKKGPLQDKMYARNKMYLYNIRRGNTLCEIYQNQQSKQLFFCRRGMMKFYDLVPEYLQSNAKLTYQSALVRRIMFEDVEKCIEEGDQVHLYSLFKENGEHCQVGYLAEVDMWLMASKNVTIVIKDEKDLEAYQKERFYWAKLIAKQFLTQISTLSPSQIQSLKSDLSGKTLIGEYCGYQKHQHITKYSSIQIIYYAMVENAGTTRCLPVEQSFRFFDKYKMKKVRTLTIKGIRKQNELYQHIYDLMKKTAMGSMAEEGEGSVLYMVGERGDKKEQYVVGLGKLKTTEYLICRKLREMLKIVLNKKGATGNNIEKFKFQMEQIVKGLFEPPKPLKYYEKLAEMAFNQVETRMMDMQEGELRYRFVSFLQQVEKNPELMKQISGVSDKSKESEASCSGYEGINRIVIVCFPKTFEPTFDKNLKELDIKVDDAFREGVQSKKNVSIVHMVPRITDANKSSKVHFILCLYTNDQKLSIINKHQLRYQCYNVDKYDH